MSADSRARLAYLVLQVYCLINPVFCTAGSFARASQQLESGFVPTILRMAAGRSFSTPWLTPLLVTILINLQHLVCTEPSEPVSAALSRWHRDLPWSPAGCSVLVFQSEGPLPIVRLIADLTACPSRDLRWSQEKRRDLFSLPPQLMPQYGPLPTTRLCQPLHTLPRNGALSISLESRKSP